MIRKLCVVLSEERAVGIEMASSESISALYRAVFISLRVLDSLDRIFLLEPRFSHTHHDQSVCLPSEHLLNHC